MPDPLTGRLAIRAISGREGQSSILPNQGSNPYPRLTASCFLKARNPPMLCASSPGCKHLQRSTHRPKSSRRHQRRLCLPKLAHQATAYRWCRGC
ncbi:host attachment protein [Klebsiella phage KL]|uniref:Host attachment protein n=1 Tax=Klebsiella phage KL TaxID=2608376 RepID=A0A5P8FS72_9CAUD|nr:host attachment protein [Klebsiella phage KL]QFQ33382.1 host attachment protein [Klebsiella phage KL]